MYFLDRNDRILKNLTKSPFIFKTFKKILIILKLISNFKLFIDIIMFMCFHWSIQRRTSLNYCFLCRFDSDIVKLYGKVIPRATKVSENYTAILEKKTKFAAQLVSNCKTFSQREKYVQLLKRYIDIDVYGSCGNYKVKFDFIYKSFR